MIEKSHISNLKFQIMNFQIFCSRCIAVILVICFIVVCFQTDPVSKRVVLVVLAISIGLSLLLARSERRVQQLEDSKLRHIAFLNGRCTVAKPEHSASRAIVPSPGGAPTGRSEGQGEGGLSPRSAQLSPRS